MAVQRFVDKLQHISLVAAMYGLRLDVAHCAGVLLQHGAKRMQRGCLVIYATP